MLSAPEAALRYRRLVTSATSTAAFPPARAHSIARSALWPLAVILVVHRVLFLAVNGSGTNDFTPVHSAIRRFLEGVPVYNENYSTVDPHYLYNPGATLLLAPLGAIADENLARQVFIVVNAVAIIAALAVLTRLVGHGLGSWLFPAAIVFAFATEAVTNTLVFTNINGVLLLVLAGFLWLFLHGHRWWSGLLLGLAIVIKPMFAPLLLLPLLKLDWRTIVGGISVPVLANLVAWPIVPGAGDYLTRVVPYLGEVRDYANASLAGFATYFGMPGLLEGFFWVILALFTAAGVLALIAWRDRDPVFWATTTSGLLLVGVFVLSSLGQQYYSMMLFPMIMTVVTRISVFRVWPAWLAAFLFLFPGSWASDAWPNIGLWLSFGATAGWAIMIITISVCAMTWAWPLRNKLRLANVAPSTKDSPAEGLKR